MVHRNKTYMEIDQSNMRQVILDFPLQFEVGFKAAGNAKLSEEITGEINSVVVVGMGGSALAGDLLHVAEKQGGIFTRPIPLFIHRSYGLPRHTDKNTLVVCISHSGNTEEVLDAFEKARKQGYPLVVITTGGTLAKLAKENNKPHIALPESNIQPRNAIGYQFSALLSLFAQLGIVETSTEDMHSLGEQLYPEEMEKQGEEIAKRLVNTTPLIYASHGNSTLSYVFKIKFNENAKTMAFANTIPELAHNEIVGFIDPKNKFTIITLRDKDDHPRIQKRMDIIQELAKKHGIPAVCIDIIGDSVYNRIFNTVLLGDWVSYHLALLYGTDPTPVAIVEDMKKRLS